MNSSRVMTSHRDGVAYIAIANPPANSLSRAVRQELLLALLRARESKTVRGIVLYGAGKSFSAGADIAELGSDAAVSDPDPGDVNELIESFPKPVVAAIHGNAFGGGLELALACHARVAHSKARLALPEVTLGLVPGAGGTQRLPRLVGVGAALHLVTTGAPVNGAKARDIGLVDQVDDKDILAAAATLAKSPAIVAARTSDRPVGTEVIDALDRARVNASSDPNRIALRACIECVEASMKLSPAQGMRYERARFLELSATTQSRALRHRFLAEREAMKWLPAEGAQRRAPIEEVGIVGAGTMGAGIAMCFLEAGIPVTLLDNSDAALARGRSVTEQTLTAKVAKGKLTPTAAETALALLKLSTYYDDLLASDLVIEAVFEDLQVKQEVFRRLDAVAKPTAILASNTSTLDLNEIARATARPQQVVGMHFFSPAHVMRLVEVVKGDATSDGVIGTVMSLAKRIRKVGVVAGVCDGFIGNRMVEEYLRQAYFLLEEGALPHQIDGALTSFGMAMGPFAMMDLAGNDIGQAIRKRRVAADPRRQVYSSIPDRLCALGRFGQKTGAGFYRYEEGSRKPRNDLFVEQLIVAESRRLGIERRDIGADEVVDRCILALVNEGARILAEGIARSASDIDVVYLAGYGFPAMRGGPMFYADTLGLPEVLERTRRIYATQSGEARQQYWVAAPLLTELAKSNLRFTRQ